MVIDAPAFNDLPCLLQRREPVLIQALRTEAAVKGFDVRTVRWRPEPAEDERDAMAMRPVVQGPRRKRWTVVHLDPLGSAWEAPRRLPGD